MTTEPMGPSEPATTWEDHDEGDRYEVVSTDAFEDFSDVDSTTVDPGPDVPDPEET